MNPSKLINRQNKSYDHDLKNNLARIKLFEAARTGQIVLMVSACIGR